MKFVVELTATVMMEIDHVLIVEAENQHDAEVAAEEVVVMAASENDEADVENVRIKRVFLADELEVTP